MNQDVQPEQAESFRAAEQLAAKAAGTEVSERFVSPGGPVRSARVIECGAGAPTLLVHGGGGIAADWIPLMGKLPDRHLIAVDRPGCGLTDGYRYTAGDNLRSHAVGFLSGVLDAMDLDAVDVVANSMGGLWSVWFALQHPRRVRSLTLVGWPALAVGTSAPVPMRLISRNGLGWMLERPATARTAQSVWKLMGHDPARLVTAYPELMELSVLGHNLPGAASSFRSLLHRALRLRGAAPDCALSEEEVARLSVPTTLVWGSHDPFGGLDAARRFAGAARAELHEVGNGHLPWLDDPEAVATILRTPFGSPTS